ncbi:MAG: hypothetical protein AAF518_27110 [Spirochaetota bacterium]
MAVMGATSSFDLFLAKKYNALLADGKKEEAISMRQQYIDDSNKKSMASNDAMNTGVLDWIIDSIKDLREHVIKGLKHSIKNQKDK